MNSVKARDIAVPCTNCKDGKVNGNQTCPRCGGSGVIWLPRG